jgi:hypothetical protein
MAGKDTGLQLPGYWLPGKIADGKTTRMNE